MKRAPDNIVLAGLMPHAPVLIPQVAGSRLGEVEVSVASMRQLSRRALDCAPARVVVISPHAPRRPGMFGIWTVPLLEGSLHLFGFDHIRVTLPNDTALVAAAREVAREMGIHLWSITDEPLDHGAVVPLHFLVEAGWSGPTVVLSLNYPGEGGVFELGEAVRRASAALPGPTVVIASGDMSHRLKSDAPAGFHPEAKRFDESFVQLIRAGDFHGLEALDPELVRHAGEDVVESTLVAATAVGFRNQDHKVLSYEGPFGVGYCVALLHHETHADMPV